jgi:hypothetical protein
MAFYFSPSILFIHSDDLLWTPQSASWTIPCESSTFALAAARIHLSGKSAYSG